MRVKMTYNFYIIIIYDDINEYMIISFNFNLFYIDIRYDEFYWLVYWGYTKATRLKHAIFEFI